MCTCIYVTDCHIKYNKTVRKERERHEKKEFCAFVKVQSGGCLQVQ